MLKPIFSILILLLITRSYGQITISGVVTDKNGHPVPGAACYFKNATDFKVASDENGKYKINYIIGSLDSLIFYAVGFEKLAVKINSRMEKKGLKTGKYTLNIILPDRVLDIVVISPDRPDTIVGTQKYSVSDFAYNQKGSLILLTYPKTLKRGSSLRLMDENFEAIDSFLIPEFDVAVELQTDFRNNVHLITENDAYLVLVVNNRLQVHLENREDYFKNVAPIVDTIGDKVYFSTYSEIYPAFDYFEYDVSDSSYCKLIYIEDSFIMPFYRAEFKYLPQRTKLELHRKQIETGIDKEIWAGALYFTKNLYYDPIYAPLFRTADDSLLVFDHYKNLMFKYNPKVGFTDSVHITYHQDARKSGWAQPLIQDALTNQIYAVFERAGNTYLREISREDGTIKRSFKLHHKYVEEMQIRGGEVQYIYRPFESIQKKYLYGEKLKFS